MTEPPDEAAPRGSGRRLLWLALKLVGTAAGFAYVGWVVDVGQVWQAFGRVAPGAVAGATAVTGLTLLVGAARWKILLHAYGAPVSPPLLRLLHIYFVGLFYNTYLPGGLGGDVVRGVVTREAFGDRGVTGALTVVLVERVLGLTGLLLLVAGTLFVLPLPGVEGIRPWTAVGLGAAAVAVIGVAIARRLSPVLPGRLGTIAASVPALVAPPSFVAALLLSLCTQALTAVAGYLLLSSLTPTVSVADAMVVVPVAAAAAFLPFTVGGAGAREAAFVALCTAALGMTEADAAAASLLLWLTILINGAAGGALQLALPVKDAA